MTSTNLAVVDSPAAAPPITADQVALIRTTIAKDATDAELQLFFHDCRRQGVHPLDKLIHFTKRSGKYTPITSIDFMRIRAAATGECIGIDDAIFSGSPKSGDFAASVTVWRFVHGQRSAFTATARWTEYKPDANDFMWQKMPFVMLGKCAEALALRKGFPQQLAGLYAKEELDQAETVPATAIPGRDTRAITPGMQKRLFAVAAAHGWDKTEMQAALRDRFGLHRTADIRRADYDRIVAAFDQPPAAAAPPDPEPPL
jgi:phage recombination protein Bet